MAPSNFTFTNIATACNIFAAHLGVFSLFIACGLVATALLLRRARSASVGTPKLRGLVADFGAVIATGESWFWCCTDFKRETGEKKKKLDADNFKDSLLSLSLFLNKKVLWTGLSFATAGFSPTTTASSPAPRIPARLAAVENAWESVAFWATASRMRAVPPRAVAAALLPAAVVAVLFFFDHGISALMARDVLRDRGGAGCGGGEKGEAEAIAETAEAGAAAAEEEEKALEAGGRAAKAAAAAAGAASPGNASKTSKLKPSAYAYDLFLCVSVLFASSEREKRKKKKKRRKRGAADEEKKTHFLFFSFLSFQQGISMVAAGIMGLPPTNGVLPQAPMHTHALSVSCGCRFFLGVVLASF